ncbi:L-glutamate gamma-semialdehyde dehydrogenase [Robiginitalea sp. M366]|uniref:L-glutamate gamma-semialdehyde dehydrogenase n=1 Tax=Robiginitalea aestuariiviva TaxID=3036903 RepID=UPI00240D743D|nr:L-glutamate gamma-semialdehyde dehydrogenase [Robiginitalea aestuariiviva]MDG1570817.1 L-glutamate gamma-semialdehyde dehydrogenase [Robiginitalea aestuariiviva]
MGKGFFQVPPAYNEPVKSYAPGSPEREAVLNQYREYYNGKADIPMTIGGKEVRTGKTRTMAPPHDHQHALGQYHLASRKEVDQAIASALEARKAWAALPWEQRAAVFLKAAELLAGPYRNRINAATMLAQSKTIHQAEIDAACELIDFLRFNVEFMSGIYKDQPESSEGIWNRVEYRPLEGFIYAITPFNFTAIAGNLPASAAMMGNTVVWKPSDHQIFSAQVIVDVFREAGLPDGVINTVFGDPAMITDAVLEHPDFSGLHFTGSTEVFRNLWKQIGTNIGKYKTYPRIVGETGGKDFILAHPSAKPAQVATAITRGAFELQGQKCSAASRVYLPKSTAQDILDRVKADLATFNKPGSPEDMSNFVTAVIHEGAFDKLASFIDRAKADAEAEIIAGSGYDKSVGYFIEPTVILTTDPHYVTMETELFGPVVTVYVYEDADWEATLQLVDQTSEYALTGAVISTDRYAISQATEALQDCAGNFYINDKPTGAVVGQQPFGGARASGTNDKAGSAQNLLRWVSPRLIKETFVTPEDYRYPFLG